MNINFFTSSLTKLNKLGKLGNNLRQAAISST